MFTQDNQSAFDNSALDAQLASIKPISLQAQATSTTPGLPSELTLVPDADETQTTEAEDSAEVITETEETEQAQDVLDNPQFTEQFKQAFGVEPSEAIEIINGLQAFRDEMSLMRTWGVSPTDYDQRMSQVREFYQGLPDDKKTEFNSVQGALAIWNHLEKQNPSTQKIAKTRPTTGKLKPAAPKQVVVKKSEVLRMNAETYRQNLPIIQAATTGKPGYVFVEDV